jgi:hypothetical protein
MKYSLVMNKERFNVLNERMSDQVVIEKEEIENDTHWVHFEITIEGQFDLLSFFHAGYHAGYDRGVELFRPKYD